MDFMSLKNIYRKLHERCPEAYVIVEKILTDKEQLPDDWPVEGTTGYDFLNYVNKLFVKSSAEPEINDLYKNFTGNLQDFNNLLYEAKKVVIEASFMGDVENLSRLFSNTLQKLGYAVMFGHDIFERVVVELLAASRYIERTSMSSIKTMPLSGGRLS